MVSKGGIMRKSYFFIVLLVIVMLTGFVSSATAYTYDGEFDPVRIFSYRDIEVNQITPDMFIVSLAGNKFPEYVIACVRIIEGKTFIIAYAFYDKSKNFKHYLLIRGHYKEFMPDADTIKMLENMLKKLHGMSDV